MRMDNSLSFVRDFERLLGDEFFAKVKSFTPMFTETDDLEGKICGNTSTGSMISAASTFSFSVSGRRQRQPRIFAI